MQGLKTRCSICGIEGRILGCPSYSDVCRDVEGCRDRALRNKDREIRQLKVKLEIAQCQK